MKKLLIIAGPSAVGKTTVAKEILDRGVGFELSRSATTRAPRGDGHDQEYLYITADEFKAKISDGEMLEYTEYGGNYYGTPLSEIERIFKEGKIPLLILDINGVVSLKNSSCGISPFAVYITADSAEIEKRLYERAERDGFSEKAMSTYEQRIKQNAIDQKRFFEVASYFDQTALNSSVSECADAILKEFLAF